MLFYLFLSKFERGVTNGWRVASSAGLISSTVKIRFRFCGVACGIWFQVRQGFSLNLHEMNAQKFLVYDLPRPILTSPFYIYTAA